MNHVVAAISYPPKMNVGTMTCSCGEPMQTDEFARHRLDKGLRNTNVLRGTGEPSIWRLRNVNAAKR